MRKLGKVFDGADYDHERDSERLGTQLERIKEAVIGKGFFTLLQISQMTGDPESSISAQLRNLRKPRFGGYKVERRHIDEGVYVYSVIEYSKEERQEKEKKEEEEKERLKKGFEQLLEMARFAQKHGYKLQPELRELGSKLRSKYA